MADFKLESYDIGGKNALANDGKLTGSEVKKAQKDGWTVWDGYSSNDHQPENTKVKKQEAKKEAEKEYINFDEFDKGGNDAIEGDGKLTGDEVARANQAGYRHICDGVTKENMSKYIAEREQGYAFGGILRATANKTKSKFAITTALVADLLIMPITMAVSFGQAFSRD